MHGETPNENQNLKDFENDFGKNEKLDTQNNPIMRAVAENYDKESIANTLNNCVKQFVGIDPLRINDYKMSEFEKNEFQEALGDFQEHLEGKEGPDAMVELAEALREIDSIVKSKTGGKGKKTQDDYQALIEAEKKANDEKTRFAEAMSRIAKAHQDRQLAEQENTREKTKLIANAGDEEKQVASLEAETIVSNWPA